MSTSALAVPPSRRAARRWVAVVAMAIPALAVGAVVLASGSASADVPQATREEVFAALGVDDVAADYVVIVDTSASMLTDDRYAEVGFALREFYAALAPGDIVTLIPFQGTAEPMPALPAGRNPDELVAQLPPDADGANTDIGRALAAALDVLERPGGPTVATVVLLTDGEHIPEPGSEFPFEEGFSWTELAARAEAVARTKESLAAFGIPLADATGVGLMRTVFAGAEVLEIDSVGELTQRLDGPKQRSRDAKARSLLASDVEGGVEVVWPTVAAPPNGSASFVLGLRSGTSHVPMQVSEMAITSTNPAFSIELNVDGAVSLPAGGQVDLPVKIHWSSGPPSWWPRAEVRADSTLALSATIESEWSQVLGQLGISFQPQLLGDSDDVAVRGNSGRPVLWLSALIAVTAVTAAICIFLYIQRNPALTGWLAAYQRGEDKGSIKLTGRRVRLPGSRLRVEGDGHVRGRMVKANDGSRQLAVSVTFRRKGNPTKQTRLVADDGRVMVIGGVSFLWSRSGVPERPAPPASAPPTSLSDPRPEPSPLSPRPARSGSDPGPGRYLPSHAAPRPADPVPSVPRHIAPAPRTGTLPSPPSPSTAPPSPSTVSVRPPGPSTSAGGRPSGSASDPSGSAIYGVTVVPAHAPGSASAATRTPADDDRHDVDPLGPPPGAPLTPR